MRAATGAIEHVRIRDRAAHAEWKLIGESNWNTGKPLGLCGSAVVDAVAELVRVGLVDESGKYCVVKGAGERLRESSSGMEYVIADSVETSHGVDITITQKDVRQIQLAKGALAVAADALLRRYGIEKPDKVLLAGAFGSYMDKANAMAIGMLPRMELEQVFVVGNAAGDGARIALLNVDKRREALELAPRVERHELPADSAFQERFIKSLRFPEPGPQARRD
jgi:uncharacterized 2Fe-2S/4Fe-4S cluster protein (DUF4445 family)